MTKLNLTKLTLILMSIGAFILLQFNVLGRFLVKSNINLQSLTQDFITYFLSIIIEAFPFVIFGVIVSVLVAIDFHLVLRNWINKYPVLLPLKLIVLILHSSFFILYSIPIFKHLWRTRVFQHIRISLTGFLLPVCECGNVPVARRIMLKGYSLSQAVTFLLAAPIINPVTLFATWKAFENFEPGGWAFLAIRLFGAFFIANFVGILLSFKKDQENYMTKEFYDECHVDDHEHDHEHSKLKTAVDTFQNEFIEVMKMLAFGAFVAALVQVIIPREILTSIGGNLFLSVAAMIVFAFVISICSNVDAFVILPYASQFTAGSILAFLIFGPMIDMKILSMLRSTFKTHLLAIITGFVTLFTFIIALAVNLII